MGTGCFKAWNLNTPKAVIPSTRNLLVRQPDELIQDEALAVEAGATNPRKALMSLGPIWLYCLAVVKSTIRESCRVPAFRTAQCGNEHASGYAWKRLSLSGGNYCVLRGTGQEREQRGAEGLFLPRGDRGSSLRSNGFGLHPSKAIGPRCRHRLLCCRTRERYEWSSDRARP